MLPVPLFWNCSFCCSGHLAFLWPYEITNLPVGVYNNDHCFLLWFFRSGKAYVGLVGLARLFVCCLLLAFSLFSSLSTGG